SSSTFFPSSPLSTLGAIAFINSWPSLMGHRQYHALELVRSLHRVSAGEGNGSADAHSVAFPACRPGTECRLVLRIGPANVAQAGNEHGRAGKRTQLEKIAAGDATVTEFCWCHVFLPMAFSSGTGETTGVPAATPRAPAHPAVEATMGGYAEQ